MSRRRDQSGDVGPLLVFALLLLVVVVVAAGIVLTRGGGEGADPAAAPAPTAPPADHQLTDTEAIARFKELDALRIEVFEEVDTASVDEVFVRQGPAARRALHSLRVLRRNRTRLVHSTYEVEELRVVENAASEVRLRQVVVTDTDFVSHNRELDGDDRPKRQVVVWTLRLGHSGWLIYDGAVRHARFLNSR